MALTIAIAPPLGFVLLAALTRQDYHQCFSDEALKLSVAMRSEASIFAHPLGVAAFVPYGLFAVLVFFRPRLTAIVLWAGATGLLLVPFAFEDFHDCDRKGTDSAIWLLIAALPALFLWQVALFLTSRRKS